MGRYDLIKKRHSDWLDLATESLKNQIRASALDGVLAKKPYKAIADKAQKDINELCNEIEDEEISKRTRAELSDFADASYKQASDMVGGLTAYQFALVLSGKPATQAQENAVAKATQMQEPPRAGYNRATANATDYRDMQKAIKAAMQDYESLTAGKNYIANVNPRNIAEMAVRFEKYQKDRKALADKGVRLVFVPGHSNCSPRCRPYQNRIYSLDGSSGSVDGKKFEPIENAADNVTYTSRRTGRTYHAGLFAYNCNHTIEAYTGQKIIQIPNKIADEAYKIDQEQRRMERTVRKLREKDQLYMTLYKRSGNKDMQKIAQNARAAALRQKERYIRYSREMRSPIYPDRLKIVVGEDIYKRTSKDKLAK